MDKMIVALDLGSNLGIATYQNQAIASTCQRLTAKELPKRFKQYMQALDAFKRSDVIAYELVRRHLGTDAAHQYGFYEGYLKAFCLEHGIDLIPYSVQAIKKFMTNKGNASKQEVIDAVNKKLNINLKNDNEADAVAILLLAIHNNEKL